MTHGWIDALKQALAADLGCRLFEHPFRREGSPDAAATDPLAWRWIDERPGAGT
jgi:hypothetical protein